MGLGVVLLFLLIVGVTAAVSLSKLGVRLVSRWLPASGDPSAIAARTRILHNAQALPYACLAWAAVVFVFQGVVNTEFLGRDVGLGDSAQAPLPNGYALEIIDVTEIVFNPTTQSPNRIDETQRDVVANVRDLQVSGAKILGRTDSGSYFLMDTRAGTRSDFGDEHTLQSAAAAQGVRLALEPFATVFDRYRWTLFDLIALLMLLVAPMVAVGLLAREVVRVRASIAPSPAPVA